MSRFRAWGMAAALAVGATGPIARAADPPAPVDSRPWYKKIFFAPKPQPGPAVRNGPVTGSPGRPVTVTAPLPPDVVAGALAAERDAWARRMDVCIKLKAIAIEKDDLALLRQVEELERQATTLYQQRVAALGVPKLKAPLPPASAAASFDLAPEKPTDPAAAAARLTAPAAPVPVGTAQIREVKP